MLGNQSPHSTVEVASNKSTPFTRFPKRLPLSVPTIVLLLAAAFIITERLWSYDKPISKDTAAYAVMAHEMLAGRRLYSDLVEIRPPAAMVSYEVAEHVVGYGRKSILCVYISVTVITLLGIYYAASAHHGASAGLWAAAYWVLLSNCGEIQGGDPNTEIFMNAVQVWAFALIVRLNETSRLRLTFAVGALFALASFYKQTTIVAPILIVAACVGVRLGDRRTLAQVLKQSAVIAAVGLVAWALLLIYFATTGRLQIFLDLLVSTGLDYAAGRGAIVSSHPSVIMVLLRNVLAPLHHESEFIPDFMNPLVLLVVIGAGFGCWKNYRLWVLIFAFTIAMWMEVALPGQFYPHYYQLLLPPIIVGAGWAIGELRRFTTKRKLIWVPQAIGGIMFSVLVLSQLSSYKMDFTHSWSPLMTDDMIAAKPLAHEITSLLFPSETFYEWGGNPYLYLDTARHPPTGVLWAKFLLGGKLAPRLSERVISDLDRASPELLVIAKKNWGDEYLDHPVVRWLLERYRPFPENSDRGPFALYIRRGGALEARLCSKGHYSWALGVETPDTCGFPVCDDYTALSETDLTIVWKARRCGLGETVTDSLCN